MANNYILFKDTPIMMELTIDEIKDKYGIKSWKSENYLKSKIIDTIEFDVVNNNEIFLFRGTIKDIIGKMAVPGSNNIYHSKNIILKNIKKNNYKFYKTNKVYYKGMLYNNTDFINKFNLTQDFYKIKNNFTIITDRNIEKFNKMKPSKKVLVRGKYIEFINFTDLIKIIIGENNNKYKSYNKKYIKMYNLFLKECNDEQKAINMLIEWSDKLNNIFIDNDGNKVIYSDIKELCCKLNKSFCTVKQRLKIGYTLEESLYVKKKVPLKIKYKTSKMKLKDICRIENKNFIDVYNFLRDVYTLDYALEHTTREFIENDE